MWTVEFLDEGVAAALSGQPADIRASFRRIVELIAALGLERVREPYVRHLEGRVWEMRMKGRDGIARAAYVTARGHRIVVVPRVPEDHTDNAAPRDRAGAQASRRGAMTGRAVAAEDVFREWETEPAFRAEYDALEHEFALAAALIRARDAAHMTQAEVATAMGTSQGTIARLESGRGRPSTRTLQRFAAATGMRLRISFEPAAPGST